MLLGAVDRCSGLPQAACGCMLSHKRCHNMQVSEPSAFMDSLKQATVMGLLDATAGGMVVYPTFRRRSISEDDSPKSPSSPPTDPRQRFFQRAGQQMVHDEGMSWHGKHSLSPCPESLV